VSDRTKITKPFRTIRRKSESSQCRQYQGLKHSQSAEKLSTMMIYCYRFVVIIGGNSCVCLGQQQLCLPIPIPAHLFLFSPPLPPLPTLYSVLTFSSLLFPSPSPLRSVVSSPSGVWGGASAEIELVHFSLGPKIWQQC